MVISQESLLLEVFLNILGAKLRHNVDLSLLRLILVSIMSSKGKRFSESQRLEVIAKLGPVYTVCKIVSLRA